MQNVIIIQVPFTQEEMTENICRKPLETICDDLAGQSPQCVMAKFINKNKEIILIYFDPKERNRVCNIINSIFGLRY
jgi:hypothetical protein